MVLHLTVLRGLELRQSYVCSQLFRCRENSEVGRAGRECYGMKVVRGNCFSKGKALWDDIRDFYDSLEEQEFEDTHEETAAQKT